MLQHAWTQSILLKILNNFFCYDMHFNSMLRHACYNTHKLNSLLRQTINFIFV